MADPVLDIVYAGSGSTPTVPGSTITFQYPAGRAAASYGGGVSKLGVRAFQTVYDESAFFVTYGPTNMTVTLGALVPALPINTQVYLQVAPRETSMEPTVAGYPIPDLSLRDGI